MLSIKQIADAVAAVAGEYGLAKASLFGSYAKSAATDESDVDLLIEFDRPAVSLLKLSALKHRLQEALGVEVDIVHAPVPANSLLKIDEVIELYDGQKRAGVAQDQY